jgi:hypothetical protein
MEGQKMIDSTSRPVFELDAKVLRAGVVMLCVGGLVWLTGAAMSATALGQAAKKWIAQLEESPTEVAQRRLHQLRVAASAGSKAWREQSQQR